MKRTVVILTMIVSAGVLAVALAGCGEVIAVPERRLAATRQAEQVAVEVEATRQYLGQQATAQAVAVQATATAAAVRSEGEELQLARQRQLQPVKTWGWVVFGVAVAGAAGVVGWRVAGVYVDRIRLVRRGPNEGEPILIIDGETYALPLRHATSDSRRLADAETQERAVMRQQAANALQARQAAKITAAKHGDGQRRLVVLPGQTHHSRLRKPDNREPGLRGVARASSIDRARESGFLPGPLADAIEGRWEEVEDDQ